MQQEVQAIPASAREGTNPSPARVVRPLAQVGAWLNGLAPWFWDATLVAYLMSGGMVFDARLALSPDFSLNQLLGLLTLGHVVWCLRRRPTTGVGAPFTILTVSVLTLVLVARSIGTPNERYATFKVLAYAAMIVPMLLHLELPPRKTDAHRLLWICFFAMFGLVALSVPHMLTMKGGQRLAVLGGGPNVLARHIGTGLLAAYFVLKLRGRRDRLAVGVVAASLVAILALVLTGTKAVLLSLGVTTIFFLMRMRRRQTVLVALSILVLSAALPLVTHELVADRQKDGALVRLLRAPDVADPQGSYGSRLRFATGTWKELATAPWLGVGTGAWGMQLDLGYEDGYPHNIVLEILGELGIIGFLLTLAPLAWWLLRSRSRASQRPGPGLSVALLDIGMSSMVVYWSINALLSGDLVDSRYLWLWLAAFEQGRH